MIIGITGALGCGKSTVTQCFAAHGFLTASADAFCRDFYASDAAEDLRKRWGEAVFPAGGGINYEAISQRIFHDPAEMEFLSSRIYPYVERRFAEFAVRCRNASCHGAIEIPLLFEQHYESRVDKTLCVWCDSAIRHERLKKYRHFDDGNIRSREERQLPPEKKFELADYGLVNNGTLEFLEQQANLLITMIQGN